jgi:hypothetical protein
VIPDDQIADAAERDPERQPDHRPVHHLEEAVPVPAHQRQVHEDGARDAAEQADPTAPDRERVEDVVEFGPVRDDVEEARADDRADQRPEDHLVHVLEAHAAPLALAAEDPRAEQEPDGDAYAVRRDRKGPPEVHAIEDRPADRGETHRHAASLSGRVRSARAPTRYRAPDHASPIARPIRSPPTTSPG